jgi:hypothetical protein
MFFVSHLGKHWYVIEFDVRHLERCTGVVPANYERRDKKAVR